MSPEETHHISEAKRIVEEVLDQWKITKDVDRKLKMVRESLDKALDWMEDGMPSDVED